MQDAGFICIFKAVLNYKDGTVKGNVDAELVLQVMIQLHAFEKAVILIQYLLEQSKLRTVLVPNRMKYSALLKRYAKNDIAFMNDLEHKVGKGTIKLAA